MSHEINSRKFHFFLMEIYFSQTVRPLAEVTTVIMTKVLILYVSSMPNTMPYTMQELSQHSTKKYVNERMSMFLLLF